MYHLVSVASFSEGKFFFFSVPGARQPRSHVIIFKMLLQLPFLIAYLKSPSFTCFICKVVHSILMLFVILFRKHVIGCIFVWCDTLDWDAGHL